MDAQSANRETDTKTDTNRARAGKPEFTRVMRIRFAGRTMGSEYTQVVNDTSRSSLTEPYLWSHLPRLSPNVRNPFPPERVPSCPKPALSHIGNAGTSHPRRQRPASVPFPKLRVSASPRDPSGVALVGRLPRAGPPWGTEQLRESGGMESRLQPANTNPIRRRWSTAGPQRVVAVSDGSLDESWASEMQCRSTCRNAVQRTAEGVDPIEPDQGFPSISHHFHICVPLRDLWMKLPNSESTDACIRRFHRSAQMEFRKSTSDVSPLRA